VNRPKVEANCCRNSEGASELHLGGRGDEERKGRAPVEVRADGAGADLQVVPRPTSSRAVWATTKAVRGIHRTRGEGDERLDKADQ